MCELLHCTTVSVAIPLLYSGSLGNNKTSNMAPKYRLQIALFVFGLSLYLLTTGAYLDNPDGRSMYSVTRSLVLRHTIAIPVDERIDTLFEKPGRNDEVYSKYGLVQPILQAPLFWLGAVLTPTNERDGTEKAVSLFQAIISAFNLVAIWAFARDLFGVDVVALAVTLSYGFATMAWLYATLTYSEPLLTLFLVLIVMLLHQTTGLHGKGAMWRMILAGTLMGVAILTKYAAVIYLPALFWYTWSLHSQNRRLIGYALGPLLVGLLLLAAYNYWRFANVFDTGYHIREYLRFPRPLWEGLFLALISPGKSIFLYAPPLFLAIISFRRFLTLQRRLAHCIAFMAVTSLLFYAVANPWVGAWSPGPRYHLPVVLLLMVAAGCLFGQWRSMRLARKVGVLSVVGLGVLVQLVAVSINYADVLFLLQHMTVGQSTWGVWLVDLAYAPLLWQFYLLVSAIARDSLGIYLSYGIAQMDSVIHHDRSIDTLNYWFINYRGNDASTIIIALLVSATISLLTILRYFAPSLFNVKRISASLRIAQE